MLKNLMRKIIYKGMKREAQEMLLSLDAQYAIVSFLSYALCDLTICVTLAVPFMSLAYSWYLNMEFSSKKILYILGLMLGYYICTSIFLKIFLKAMCELAESITQTVYYRICTRKGKAISKKDFAKIKKNNKYLFRSIRKQECRGYCYIVCFAICKALRKGKLEFIAVKIDEDIQGKPKYTMHVLYVNNGWAFDTYSARQYPVEKYYQICGAKLYKSFDFSKIKDKQYEEFRQMEVQKLSEWAVVNNCSEYWSEEEEES